MCDCKTCPLIFSLASPRDHLTPLTSLAHTLRNRNADLLRRFEIDDEFEFDRLLEGNISWIDAVEILST